MRFSFRWIWCFLGLCLTAGCLEPPPADTTQQAPKPDQLAPARIDALMTSRFQTIRSGGAFDRAQAMLLRASEQAGFDKPPFLRLLIHPRPEAYSNGGAVIYITTGAVLLANDAQLFMLLAHELAHLEAQNLHVTQAEKSTIRAWRRVQAGAARQLSQISEDRREQERLAEEEEDRERARAAVAAEFFDPELSPDPRPVPFSDDDEEDDSGFFGALFGALMEDAAKGAAPFAVAIVSEQLSNEAEARLIDVEAGMDARAFELGKAAGFDGDDLLSSFRLLHPTIETHPFLGPRARRISALVYGGDGERIPAGQSQSRPKPGLVQDALATVHTLAQRRGTAPENAIRQIHDFVKSLEPTYGQIPAFKRGAAAYTLGYGGIIGINPNLIRPALAAMRAAGAPGQGLLGEVWFGCEVLRLRPAFLAEIPRLARMADRALLRELRAALLDDRNAERDNSCDRSS